MESEDHYWTVLRYVERKLLRADTVLRSQDWEWSSVKPTIRSGQLGLIFEGLLPSRRTGRNMSTAWKTKQNWRRSGKCREGNSVCTIGMATTATQLGLESSLRPRGRPKSKK